MARCRGFVLLLFLLASVCSFATDYRLVIASDDPNTRQAPALTVYEGTGKLNKDDRITSITFSAGADMKANCLVSLDPSSGKADLALSPDVEVYKGKVLLAGAKPTRKVIPANLSIDVPIATTTKQGGSKLSQLVQPIIREVDNLPWGYIGFGFLVVLASMYLMNRRSQAFTTSMSKEAKNLYLETVKSIVDRLDKIETTQHNLVKNPPVARAFRAQIEGFEAKLARLEKMAQASQEQLLKTSAEAGHAGERHEVLMGEMASASRDRSSLQRELESLKTDLGQFAKVQIAMREDLGGLAELQASANKLAEQLHLVESKLADAESRANAADAKASSTTEALMASQAKATEEASALHAQLEALRQELENGQSKAAEEAVGLRAQVQGLEAQLASMSCQMESEASALREQVQALQSMPAQMEAVHAGMASLPAEFESVRSAMPDLGRVEAGLEAISPRLDGLGLDIDQIHESILKQIEGLSGRVDESRDGLGELISAHNFAPAMPAEEPAAALEEEEVAELDEQPVAEAEMPECFSALPVEEELEPVEAMEEPAALLEEEPEAALPEESLSEEVAELEELPAEMPESMADLPMAEELEPVEVAEEPTAEMAPEDLLSQDLLSESLEPAAATEAWLAEGQAGEAEEVLEEASSEDEHLEEAEATEALEQQAEPEVEEPFFEAIPEFHFDNVVQQIASHVEEDHHEQEEAPLPAMTFKLEPLPDHLETFEDGEPAEVLSAFKEAPAAEGDESAVEEVLVELFAHQATEEPEVEEEMSDSKSGAWLGEGGSAAKTWSASCSRTPELIAFDGELKPMTPIGTAPIGAVIGAAVYAGGRIVYACGQAIHGFWPGREDRVMNLDHPMPTDAWRLAVKGQNLFVAEKNRVKIVSLQGWFTLEQFSGEYLDQIATADRWVGVRDSGGAVLDFRDHRGHSVADAVQLNAPVSGLKLCADERRVYAGTADGRILEVSDLGFEEIARGPEGAQLVHLCLYQDAPLALFATETGIEVRHNGKSCILEMKEFAGAPVLMGHKLFLADLQKAELACVNLKKMQASFVPALAGVAAVRRVVGLHHGAQQTLLVVTCDDGKSGGRLILIDPKSGKETRLCAASQSNIDLICADHHVVLATSCQYQNVIRVMEPFAQRIAA